MFENFNFSRLLNYKEQVSRSNSWGQHFLFYNVLLTAAIGLSYLYAAPETSSFLSFVYLLLTWLGHTAFLCFVIYVLLFFPLSFISNFKIYRAVAVLLATLSDIALLFDAKLFLTVKVHASWSMLRLIFGDLDFKTGLNYNFMYIALPVILSLQVVFSLLATRDLYRAKPTFLSRALMVTSLLCFLGSHGLYIWADAARYEGVTALRSVFPLQYPTTARTFLTNHGWLPKQLSSMSGAPALNYPLSVLEVEPPAHSEQLVVIFVNGLSYGDLSADTTPHLLDLKREALSFESHYLPYQESDENIFAAIYGLPLFYKFMFEQRHIFPVIMEELRRQNYDLRFLASGPRQAHSGTLATLTGSRRLPQDEFKNDQAVLERSSQYATQSDAEHPQAQLVVLDDLHSGALDEQQRRKTLKSLDGALHVYLDSLKESGALQHTVVVITSGQGNPALQSQGAFVRQRQHVPLIVLWPDDRLRGVSKDFLSSHFDLVPTFGREVLGISNQAAEYSTGVDLLSKSEERNFIVTTSSVSSSADLLLIAPKTLTVYTRSGRSYIQSEQGQQEVQPRLQDLVRALREMNRFIK